MAESLSQTIQTHSEERAEPSSVSIVQVLEGEDVFAYVQRVQGGFEHRLYQQVVGAANPFKEGDATIGVSAANETTRLNARRLLAHTRLGDLDEIGRAHV